MNEPAGGVKAYAQGVAAAGAAVAATVTDHTAAVVEVVATAALEMGGSV
jgi:hypothetical protein